MEEEGAPAAGATPSNEACRGDVRASLGKADCEGGAAIVWGTLAWWTGSDPLPTSCSPSNFPTFLS